ncbi:hypothetical protein CR513_24220, partial [Mucuna pruriens]
MGRCKVKVLIKMSSITEVETSSEVMGKLCFIILDRGSNVNVTRLRLVEKLAIPTFAHPKPYKLQWLSERGELLVDKQVAMAFTLGNCEDKVVHDVVPMEATYILLGRPWWMTHDGVTNRFTFVHIGQKVVLNPLSLREVSEDQDKMRLKREILR